MRQGPRRALVGLLSIAAVLLPAAGLAYLGAGSYQADRGLVASKLAEHNRAAQAVAADLERQIGDTLDAVDAVFADSDHEQPEPAALDELRAKLPMAAHPFRIGDDGRVRYAVTDPLARRARDALVETSFSPRAIQADKRRLRQLEDARRRELRLCREGQAACKPDARAVNEVRRLYGPLVGYDNTGPAALLGLARVHRLVGDREGAAERYEELRTRYGDGLDGEGLGYDFIAALGAAEVAADAGLMVEVYRRVVAGEFRAPSPALLAIGDMLRRELKQRAVAPALATTLRDLDGRLDEAREYARFTAELESEVETVMRTAIDQPRGRPALHHGDRTLVYRRDPAGGIVGIVVDDAAIDEVAAQLAIPIDAPAPTTRAQVTRLGTPADADVRTMSTAGFGTLLPHLTVSIVNDRAMGDPLDEIVRQRGRRHLLLTGGLVALLLLGVWATVRSAARERELARLKSDFVSTVSHELKTPLTSIRMFAEMLQEGVAGGDESREAHYHEIIVRESERLGLLIANVLDYSQIERGTRRYTLEEESAADVAREAVETFQRLREGETTEVVFEVDAAAAAARVNVDSAVVVQSLLNLLANAAKYGGNGAPIETRVRRADDGCVSISVRDHGPGIPRSEQAAVFREFYRTAEAYSSGVEGTGLGLALVKRHVEALGGRVDLDSVVGRGATFSIVLPEVRE
jgi:signal transduction histidine kinase